MPATCMHGFAPGECLICRTLGTTTDRPVAAAQAAPVQDRRETRTRVSESRARPDMVYSAGESAAKHHRRLGGSVILVVAALVAIGAAAWILAGIVFSALHLLELIAVAAGAGWVGYKIGHFRGSRRRPERS